MWDDDFEDVWNDDDDDSDGGNDDNDDDIDIDGEDFNELFTSELFTTVCTLWELNEDLLSKLFLSPFTSFLLVCL